MYAGFQIARVKHRLPAFLLAIQIMLFIYWQPVLTKIPDN